MKALASKTVRKVIALLLILMVSGTGNVFADVMYYVHTDHLGTPVVITDSTQKNVWQGNKQPFGKTDVSVNLIEFNVRFPGQYYDAESGLHYNYFRDYDPATGRYVQSDPIGLGGGLNTYGYAYQNPAIYTDPTGELVPAIIGGIILLATANSANAPTTEQEANALEGASVLGVIGGVIDNFPSCKLGAPIKKGVKEAVAKSGIQANKAAGDAFEQQVMGQLQQTQSGVVQQVTVKTQSGVKTRIDLMGRDANGNIVCTECKASATAPLTKSQAAAFPEIQQSGAVVVGKGKPGFPGGTQIPPTTVDIIRP